MLQKQSLHLDESQEFECQKLKNRLQYEMDVLMAYQKKNRMQSQTQRERERKELEERVSVRRALLESKVSKKRQFRRNIFFTSNYQIVTLLSLDGSRIPTI